MRVAEHNDFCRTHCKSSASLFIAVSSSASSVVISHEEYTAELPSSMVTYHESEEYSNSDNPNRSAASP